MLLADVIHSMQWPCVDQGELDYQFSSVHSSFEDEQEPGGART